MSAYSSSVEKYVAHNNKVYLGGFYATIFLI